MHFESVQYLCLPFVIRGLTLRAATAAEWERLAAHRLEPAGDLGVYLSSTERDRSVIAGSAHRAEARPSYNDEPVFRHYAGDEDVVTSIGILG